MKYETKTITRTTPSGGTETVTESVPVYSKHEKKSMAKKAKAASDAASFVASPWFMLKLKIALVALGILIILIIYLVISANIFMEKLLSQYNVLSGVTSQFNSKENFIKSLQFVTGKAIVVNSNGIQFTANPYMTESGEYYNLEQNTGNSATEDTGSGYNPSGSEYTIGDPIDGTLSDYVNAHYAEWSCSNSRNKQETLAAVYFTLNNTGISRECIAGILGNCMHEGNTGQFEGIPYGDISHQYYRNSWENSHYYNLFPSRSGTPQEKVYSTYFSNKQCFNINGGMSYVELYDMLAIGMAENVNVFGFGPIQATSRQWHQKYRTAISNVGLSASPNSIRKEDVLLIDAEVIRIGAVAVFSNGVPSEGANLSSNNNTYARVIQKVEESLGPLTNEEKNVVSASAYWQACVEVCAGYTQIDKLKERAVSSVSAYRTMRGIQQ